MECSHIFSFINVPICVSGTLSVERGGINSPPSLLAAVLHVERGGINSPPSLLAVIPSFYSHIVCSERSLILVYYKYCLAVCL